MDCGLNSVAVLIPIVAVGGRREVAELAERVDFTERLLAKPGDPARKGS